LVLKTSYYGRGIENMELNKKLILTIIIKTIIKLLIVIFIVSLSLWNNNNEDPHMNNVEDIIKPKNLQKRT